MTNSPIHWFRHSLPYINTHRNKTFVIMFGGQALDDPSFTSLIHDIALLHSLGIRLVLVHGARVQIDRALATLNINSTFHHNVRITPPDVMPHIVATVGAVRFAIEAQFSKGLANTPLFGAKISTISGNFISAKPYGVRDGVDYQLTGEVRRIDTSAIIKNLEQNHIVLLGSVGFSATGEMFNLESFDVATHVAIALNADKLILLDETLGVSDTAGNLIREMTVDDAHSYLQSKDNIALRNALTACQQGVARVHLLSYQADGALLKELFSTDGFGTMVSQNPYDTIRHATTDDIVGIIKLIQPLEQQGILIPRSRERLEEEIEYFCVIERDGKILGCACLYDLGDGSGEIASIAIDPAYRRGSRGVDLLNFIENQAKAQNMTRLFALTTRTLHWFIEQGFSQTTPDTLPPDRHKKWHNGRNSKVLVKYL